MKKLLVIFSLLFFAFISCDKLPVEKPEDLINEKDMIKMLIDIHIAEATFNQMRYDSIIRNSSSANFYYSILEKYQIPDSVFEKSFIFYASTPKHFEEMYQDVMNKLSEIEQDYSGRKKELLEFDPEE
ncbi:MAG: DUF4296 domain-containing protein [Bacteroidetes bacterium]|nr:DUF4296 domain-containing protein [Bacteroidota bacterium]